MVDWNDGSSGTSLTKKPELLVGTWRWHSSTYYFTPDGEPRKKTPETAGYAETLVFYESGTVDTYRDGVLEERATYEVKKRTYPNGTESEDPMLFIDGRPAEFGVSEQKLQISTAFKDGPETIYRRAD